MKVSEILKVSKKLKTFAANLSEQEKNNALTLMSQSLIENTELILSENKKDLENYGEGVMADRLRLTKERIKAMAQGILDVAKLNDPVGKILEERTLYNGLNLKKVSVPVGVVAVIYESRPNVTSDAAALLLKSGNVCILRGGKEAFLSSSAIVKALKEGLKKANLPEDLISMPDSTDRSETNLLMTATGYVDLLIPRGGAGLIKACTENATVPCIETGTGICHIYVDEFADIKKALKQYKDDERTGIKKLVESFEMNIEEVENTINNIRTLLQNSTECQNVLKKLDWILKKSKSNIEYITKLGLKDKFNSSIMQERERQKVK